jgi:hypothetical protein
MHLWNRAVLHKPPGANERNHIQAKFAMRQREAAFFFRMIVLRQIPRLPEVAGILLVAGGVALHKEAEARSKNRAQSTDGRMNELEHLEAARSVHRD